MAAAVSFSLDPDARSVGFARSSLREVMLDAGSEAHLDAALLALSEVVTNALVHAGTGVKVSVWSAPEGTRVEVEDGGTHLPVRRHYADTAGTGRGLALVDEFTDRWGAIRRGSGKAVWFELGTVLGHGAPSGPKPQGVFGPAASSVTHTVTLRAVPLLMHWAWQEHAAALLREYLLHVLEDDDTILDKHSAASEAMSLLEEQMPAPNLGGSADDLMVGATGPGVTADEVLLRVPAASVPHFVILDDLLRRAIHEARAGHFLGPPTQPEISEMRTWICTEVARQCAGDATVVPWVARTNVRATLADQATLGHAFASLSATEEALLATNEASIIVAASPSALSFLGYEHRDELLGQRVLVVVPTRYHQAHIAGTTLNATHGRDNLLGVPIEVPMVRKDGSEILVSIMVRPERFDDQHPLFVARFRPS